MNATNQSISNQLRSHMASAQQSEVECQEYLQYANALLAPPLATSVQHVREQVAMAGRSDYFLICEVYEVALRRKLVLWEVKAPQLPTFEVVTKNRLIPSKSLVEAENQLLYYYDEYRGNSQFLDRYDIRHPNDVVLGGIIIGRDDNIVKDKTGVTLDNVEKKQLAASAYRIRDEHFYHGRIRLLTWDRIASLLDAPSQRFE